MPTLEDHLFGPGPKRILSLDGGGVRGIMTLGILRRVETILKTRSPDPDSFRLSDYFDLIGGTSTGGIIATLLALGKSVDEVIALYYDMCPKIFGRRTFLSWFFLRSKFDAKGFRGVIDDVFDDVMRKTGRSHFLYPEETRRANPPLGTEVLKTGLAVVTKRIDTSSLWVLTNNPRSKYWDPESEHWRHIFADRGEYFRPNRDYSLRAIVQATASAPTYLDPVDVEIAPDQQGLFLDGGVSPCNNPALELFYMTTLKAYGAGGNGQRKVLSPFGFEWQTGQQNLFMLSLGTGSWRERKSPKELKNKLMLANAIQALLSIMNDTQTNATTIMQSISETPGMAGWLNGNVGDMRNLRILPEPLLTFKRLDPRLEAKWLTEQLGQAVRLGKKILENSREMDNPNKQNLDLLHLIGIATGQRFITDLDFPPCFDLAERRMPVPGLAAVTPLTGTHDAA